MNPDRPLLGIMLMLAFCAIAPMGDSMAKILGGTIPLLQLVFARFAFQFVLLFPSMFMNGRTFTMSRYLTKMCLLRTVFHIIGLGAMFLSLQYLPLADAIAIAFVMPFIMLLLGKFVLNEEIGSRRLIACVIGFIGTLLVIQPSFSEVGLPALLPLLVAVVFALFMLITRHIAKEVDPISLQFTGGVMASVIILVLYAVTQVFPVFPFLEPSFVVPNQRDTLLLIASGIAGTLAHLCMTWSLRFAPSATLAPMQYLEIPIATAFGYMIFNDLPNGLAALGILITIAAGLYVVFREHAMARSAAIANKG